MSFQDWLNAVDKLLAEGDAGYTTAQIEKADLRAAHQQGVSPVDYVAQGDHPLVVTKPAPAMPLPLPPISLDQAKFLVRTLDQAGLALIVLAVLVFAFGLFQTFGNFGEMLNVQRDLEMTPGGPSRGQWALAIIIRTVDVISRSALTATLGIIAWAVSGMLRATYPGSSSRDASREGAEN